MFHRMTSVIVVSLFALSAAGCTSGTGTSGDAGDTHPWDAAEQPVEGDAPQDPAADEAVEPLPDMAPDDASHDLPPDATDAGPDHDADGGGDATPDIAPDDAHFDAPADEAPDAPLDHPVELPDISFDVWVDRPDVAPDTTCVQQGCTWRSGATCCAPAGHEPECSPPGAGCTQEYCIVEGDGACDPHETCYNSGSDCGGHPCVPGSGVSFSCGMIESQRCACNAPACRPECRYVGTRSEGWYDSCTSALMKYAFCSGCTASCGAICSRSEGWYDSCAALIAYRFCRPEWECMIIW